ncbi:hypothetical protein JIN77_15685 [Verrucomicrobiaceae bacterium R5-34]|uniref:Uncharacterized protein n=1 Tax=Oceaniferula flava TaxID=2800421 RepID=A0AAE2SDM4_9BACT|nr:hypothetical protein [Oceaniferula flavus]MBK1832179.1 hypothetical protein [Verrucomicrobiaceae bacterium R5-34]MBK1855829.1 hypothetical protein [Oceaniferula flavus]MBM1137136.1 hypothetical protein [Oceaniferula flavus]
MNTLVYIHSHAADHLAGLGKPEPVAEFISQLERNPETVGDYRQPDPRGRMIEVKILGRQAVLFFKDPFAGLVKILEIRNVEGV